MHIAYLDDSRDEKGADLAVIGALLIPDSHFHVTEAFVGLAVEQLIPEDKLEKFEEFHAAELHGGHGVFEGIEDGHRYEVIRNLLNVVAVHEFPFVYSAVSRKALSSTAFGSSEAIDIAFRMCARAVEEHMRDRETDGLCLFIFDDTTDVNLKRRLRATFAALRKRVRPPNWNDNTLCHSHDDMYFGDSKYSIGIQLADLCTYFVSRNIKHRSDPENFFEVFRKVSICAKVEPEWSQSPGIFLEAI